MRIQFLKLFIMKRFLKRGWGGKRERRKIEERREERRQVGKREEGTGK